MGDIGSESWSLKGELPLSDPRATHWGRVAASVYPSKHVVISSHLLSRTEHTGTRYSYTTSCAPTCTSQGPLSKDEVRLDESI